jgi:Zn-finger nucleic acid-binding protein
MELSERHGHYICRHCGTFHFPDTVDGQGIRVLGPSEAPLPCPVCKSMLVLAMLDEQLVEYCTTCRGLLVPREGFAEIVRRRRSWATGPPVIPIPPEPGELPAAHLSQMRQPSDRGSLLRPGQHRDGRVRRL